MSDRDRSSPSLTDTPLKTYIGRHDDDYPLINGNENMAKPKMKQTKEEKLEKKRIAEKLRYEKIKNDPQRLAAEKEKRKQKYKKLRESGKKKLVSEMSAREKRQARKNWREYSDKAYKKKKLKTNIMNQFVRENTPSSLDDEPVGPESRDHEQPQQVNFQINVPKPLSPTPNPRLKSARGRSLKQRYKRNQELKQKNALIVKLKQKLSKYKKRCQRLEKQKKKLELTPKTAMTKLAEDPTTRVDVVKKALFGDVLEKQISENMSNLKTRQEKKVANKLLLGHIVNANKAWKLKNKVITYKKMWNQEKQKKTAMKQKRCLKKMVQIFLEDDKYSRLCAGKKEFVRIKATKQKVQRRYRLDTLRNLHKEFLKSGNVTMSYSMFARLAPAWIVAPKLSNRDTCLCTVHANFQHIVTALYNTKIIKVPTYQNLLNAVCCDRFNEQCLERKCEACAGKSLPVNDFNADMPINYNHWLASKESIIDIKTKKERQVVKQKRESITTTAQELVLKLKTDLNKIFQHERNIVHQYQVISEKKKSLTEQEALIHMDFSENFSTKYNEEIQSFHFGGSRTQLSLHTVVMYLKGSKRSYCTVSSDLSHNVYAIWAHLKPVLDELPSQIETIHFLSDGPVTQYRNKIMFFTLASKMTDLCPGLINWTWNYHEAGHGKGAPDGVGAVCKRTANDVVACGGDVTNLIEFCGVIQNRCPGITLFIVTKSEIEDMEKLISSDPENLISFNGTLKVHQVQGSAFMPRKLQMKSLSCFCDEGIMCKHYRMGLLEYSAESRQNFKDVYESETESKDQPDDMSVASDLTLNLENPEVLATMPDLQIDPTTLFPDLSQEPLTEKRNQRKCKTRKGKVEDTVNEQSKQEKEVISRKNKFKKAAIYKKQDSRQKNKFNTRKYTGKENDSKKAQGNKNDFSDCECLICGVLYSEDTTGNDWVQCLICNNWAQDGCIKGESALFTCPDCSADCDYKK